MTAVHQLLLKVRLLRLGIRREVDGNDLDILRITLEQAREQPHIAVDVLLGGVLQILCAYREHIHKAAVTQLKRVSDGINDGYFQRREPFCLRRRFLIALFAGVYPAAFVLR